ncbi:hypothetical protein J4H86_04775 [Spiractinospora alimapuensis]|nr:hypothetical protein J4H86_04775 [Spiractinospora alimapuensis]
MRRHLVLGGATAVAAAVLGPLVGILWWWIVPRDETTVGPGGELQPPEPTTLLFLDEAYFSVLGAVVGLVCGILAYLAQYRASAASGTDLRLAGLVGVTLGTGLAAVLAWRTGLALDAGTVARAMADAGEGDTVPVAMELRAYGALLLWPFTAVLQYGVFDAVSIIRRDLGHHRGSRPPVTSGPRSDTE